MRSFTESTGQVLYGCSCGYWRGELDFFLASVVPTTEAHRPGRALLVHEPDHVRQGGEVAQLAVLIARNVVDLADRREHFRLFDGVDTEVGFEIQFQVQHVFGIASLLRHNRQNVPSRSLALSVPWSLV